MSTVRVAFALTFAFCAASPLVQAREPFYLTPVEDEATKMLAAKVDEKQNRQVIPYYSESHALLIGNSNYVTFKPSLPGVMTEMGRLADTLHQHRFKVEVHFDLNATQMMTVIDDFMRKRANVQDARVLVYVSGHGVSITQTRPFGYVVPVDAPDEQQAGRRAVARASVPMQLFAAWAQLPSARHMMFVFDSCFSGSFFQRPEGASPPAPLYTLPPARQNVARAPRGGANTERVGLPIGPENSNFIFEGNSMAPGRQFLTAGSSNETVPADSKFTDLFIRLLDGSLTADAMSNHDRWATGREIGEWLQNNASSRYMNRNNAPTPAFGSLRDGMFENGNMVFTRLDVENPFLIIEPPTGRSPRNIQFPAQGTVVGLVTQAIMTKAATKESSRSSPTTSLPGNGVSQVLASAVQRTVEAQTAQATADAASPKASPTVDPRAASATAQASELTTQAAKSVAEGLRESGFTVSERVVSAAGQAVQVELAALTAKLAAVPTPSPGATLTVDEEKRIQQYVDQFSSTDPHVRRSARAAMATYLAELTEHKSRMAITRLVRDMANKSYRFQLGLAVALADGQRAAPVLGPDSTEVTRELRRALAAPAGQDPTLSTNLKRAISKFTV